VTPKKRRDDEPERLRYVVDKNGTRLCFRWLPPPSRKWVRISLPLAERLLEDGRAVDETNPRDLERRKGLDMTLTPAMMRAIEYVAQCERRPTGRPRAPSQAMFEQLVDNRMAIRAPGQVPGFALTDFGSVVLEAYKLGRRRWGASGR